MKWLPLAVIYFYRWFIGPWLRPSCRYLPTCSSYGLEAITRHGAFYGSWLTLKRIGRCHPWGGHGYDPVPEAKSHPEPAPCCSSPPL